MDMTYSTSTSSWRGKGGNARIYAARSRPILAAQSRLILAGMLVTVIVHGVALVTLGKLWQTRSVLLPIPLEITLVTPPPPVPPREIIPPAPKPAPAINPPAPLVTRPRPPTPVTPPAEPIKEPLMSIPTPPPVMRQSEPISQVEAPVVAQTPVEEARTEPVDASPSPVVPPSFNAAYLNNPPPLYPPRARKLGLQGTVMLRVVVSAAGHPEQINVLTSSGVPLLDEAAINTVRQWTFAPARQGDRPVAGAVNVPIRFVLN